MPVTRNPARDRAYLENQIAFGHTVNVDGISYNKANLKDLPSQEKLDALDAPAPSPTVAAVGAPPTGSPNQQPGALTGAAGGAPAVEPEFAGKKLGEFAGKTDAQIAKIDGVTPEMVPQIRAALTVAKK